MDRYAGRLPHRKSVFLCLPDRVSRTHSVGGELEDLEGGRRFSFEEAKLEVIDSQHRHFLFR